jgi:Tol biopolymer transport system component
MDLATGEERRLTRMGVVSWVAFFHPSGNYLIFASNREGLRISSPSWSMRPARGPQCG